MFKNLLVRDAIAVVFAGLLGDWLGLEKTYLISSLLALGAVPFVLMLKKGKVQNSTS